ncbi:MAG: 2-oxoglutarate dehydrogenase, E2 component, dihydrolipoamide succinyltransferase, partial [Microbacteriaceae bacterium]|nr:2-oxoglutarate dehydrogenase, E2 component, dihydrolipoamide succinyltransferase [Microbacteriaceae bacterium]
MTQDVTLPALGESVTEGTVTRWLKQVGDTVEVDEALLEVSTDKVDTEVPSPVAGTIQEILVGEDETVEVGAVLARVGSGAASKAEAPKEEPKQEAPKEQPKQEAPKQEAPKEQPKQEAPKAAAPTGPTPPRRPAAKSDPRYVTPIVRKLAEAEGVDLTQITGTGVGGRIRKEDVAAAAERQRAAAPAPAAAGAAPA